MAILMMNIFSGATVAAQSPMAGVSEDNRLIALGPVFDKKIAIVYGGEEQFALIAEGIKNLIEPFYQPVDLIEISSVSDIAALPEDYWITVQVYDTTPEGPIVSGMQETWSDLAVVINSMGDRKHALAIANTKQASQKLGPALRNSFLADNVTEMTDAALVVISGVWNVAEILINFGPTLDYQTAGTNLRELVVQYFSENSQDLVNRGYEPQVPVGQIDEVEREDRYQEMLKNAPRTANYVTDEGVEIPLETAVKENMIDENEYGILLSGDPADDLVVATLPTKSGIEGAAGDVIDILLKILVEATNVGVIKISPEVAEQIKTIMNYIPALLGIIEDPSVENILSTAFTILAKRFPGIAEYEKYVNIAIEGYKALRGDTSEIVAFALKMVKEFFPENSSVVFYAEKLLNDNLVKLVNKIKEGEDTFKAITSWLTDILTDGLIDEPLKKMLGTTYAKLAEHAATLVRVIKSAIEFYQKQDTKTFILETLPKLFAELKPFIDAVREMYNFTQKTTMNSMGSDGGSGDVYSTGILDDIESWKKKIQPLIEIGKIGYWIGSKIGAIKDSKDFLEKFPLNEVVDKFFEAVYIATGNNYPDISTKVKQYGDLLKSALNGTLISTVANNTIDDIVDDLPSLTPAVKDYVKRVFKYMVARLFQGETDLKRISRDTLDKFLIEGILLFLNEYEDEIKEIVGTIANYLISGLMSVTAAVKKNVALAELVIDSIGKKAGEILQEVKQKALSYIKSGVDVIISYIPDSILNSTLLTKIKGYVERIPNFILSFISASTDSDSSWTTIMRELGMISIQALLDNIVDKLQQQGITDVPYDLFLQMAQSMFNGLLDNNFDLSSLPSMDELIDQVLEYIQANLASVLPAELVNNAKVILTVLSDLNSFFEDGLNWIARELKKWVASKIVGIMDTLLQKLNDLFDQYKFFEFSGVLPVGLGPFTLFEFTYGISLSANIDIDGEGLKEFIMSLVFEGNSALESTDLGGIMKKIFSFLSISPVLAGSLGVRQLDTSEGGLLAVLLEILGVTLTFEGNAFFKLQLFDLGPNGFDSKNFFKLLAWGLSITITLSRRITILDLFTGGVGGGFIGKVAKYLRLDVINIDIRFSITLFIEKRAETPTTAASGVAILSFLIEAMLNISLGVDFGLAGAKITITVGIRMTLTFTQELLNRSQPLRIIFNLILIAKIKLKVKFLFKSKSWSWDYSKVLYSKDLSPKSRKDVNANGGMGYDADFDGIPDEYERSYPGLNVGFNSQNSLLALQGMDITTNAVGSSTDTDGDGLEDKLELKYTKTDPTIPDSDGDGLTDFEEVKLFFSNPLEQDSDFDGINDYDEAKVYGTSPLNSDTDTDGLTDYFEITFSWDVSNITQTVFDVNIGGVLYDNKTDPLNPDTDGDLLLDGQEGKFGPYYGGLQSVDPYFESTDLVWNNGYTHPLDNDTDDDSYLQSWNGSVLPSRTYLGDLRDGVEVRGITATVRENGDYVTRVFYTDPTRADSDRDTGPGGDGVVMESDGYELFPRFANEEPTDPLSGDLDNDGLLDTLEDSIGTDIFEVDTDGDKLNDKLEYLLKSDPLSVDTDGDKLEDGDEYFTLKTNLLSSDTDFDGITDYDELFVWGTNPGLEDSDVDGFLDGYEIEKLGTSPSDTSGDADGDGLTDFDELFIYGTDPSNSDTDGDMLSDYDEIYTYSTNPLDTDSDGDSVLYLDSTGNPVMLLGDYEEVMVTGTNPALSDSDSDGISDAIELYLAKGIDTPAIPLNPNSADTDGDGLRDGSEITVTSRVSGNTIIYEIENPLNSSAVLSDTDSDGVSDLKEVDNAMRPDYWDTDGDFLPDYEELEVYNTSPTDPDSDDDGIIDSLELVKKKDGTILHHPGVDFEAIRQSGIADLKVDTSVAPSNFKLLSTYEVKYYNTYSWDDDTDDDMLPDVTELIFYQPNFPNFTPEVGGQDTNGNGIIDGLDLDLDNDGLEDGAEFYDDFATVTVNDWAIFDPDVDRDTVMDGFEEYYYNTKANETDTDGDTYSDGFEIIVGSDPLTPTSASEMQQILDALRSPVRVISPKNGYEFENSTVPVPIVAFSIAEMQYMEYQYREYTTTDWSSPVRLALDTETSPNLWWGSSRTFDDGIYEFRARGMTMDGNIFSNTIIFSVNRTIASSLAQQYEFGGSVIGIIGTVGVAGAAALVLLRRKNA